MLFNPRQQFDSPDWAVLTATDIEGQLFERKVTSDVDALAKAISAFANSNPEGGLIVNGIADDGTVEGLDGFGEAKIKELLKVREKVTCSVDSKILITQDPKGSDVQLQFIYVPFSVQRVVETNKRKAYKRAGDSTFALRDEEKREMEYQKGQIAFEDEPACPLVLDELDRNLLHEFLSAVRTENHLDPGTEDLKILRNRHLVTFHQNQYYLTHAGLLLLHADPEWHLPGAYARFLRYEGHKEQAGYALNTIQDKFFRGPVPTIIRDLRKFVDTQIRKFSYRNSDGGFVEVPEYPESAWYEVIDNALIHRSYSYRNVGIHIKMFNNRLEVVSPGDYPLGISPDQFSSNPRNPHLMGAMRYLRFVKMVSEGTKRIFEAMEHAELPPPEFSPVGRPHVTVILRNDLDQPRED